MSYISPKSHISLLSAALLLTTTFLAKAAPAPAVFDLAVAGTSCKQNTQGSLLCKYKVGRDLEFSITAAGEPETGISFLRSNIKGDYYARFGVMHGCVIVAQGEATAISAPTDYAFVSPMNGRVYRTWQECKDAKQ